MCHRRWVPIDLKLLKRAIDARTAIWAGLNMDWIVRPVVANYGKPVVRAEFESESWIGDVMIWISGDAELVTIRFPDNFMVNKHYDLHSSQDLYMMIDELATLLSSGTIPASAITTYELTGPLPVDRRVDCPGPPSRYSRT